MTDTETSSPKIITKSEGHFWLAVFECCESPPKVPSSPLQVSYFSSITNKPQIDFDKLAEKCNYKNAATARVMFGNKRRALRDAELAAGTAPPPASPKRGRKPKPKADGEGGEGDGEPVKKRGRGRPRKVVPEPEGHVTTEEEFTSA